MKTKLIIFLTPFLFITLANANTSAQVIVEGQYSLTKATSGHCPVKLEVKVDMAMEVQVGAYTEEAPMVIFQLDHVNEGARSWPTVNPMTGLVNGYQYTQSDMQNGTFSNSFKYTGVFAELFLKTNLKGSFTEDSITFESTSYNRDNAAMNYTQNCSYKLNN